MMNDDDSRDGRSQPPRRWKRVVVPALACGVAAVALRDRLPDPAEILTALRGADVRWLAAAVVAQFLSQVAFAYQQHTLLAAFAVRVPIRELLAITYSRSAISMALPGGSAVSAAFALQQYRRHGAATATATAAMLLSAAASFAGLCLLYTTSSITGIVLTLLVAATGAGVLIVGSRRKDRPGRQRRISPRARARPYDRILDQVRRAAREARTIRIRDGAVTTAFAALNWLLDLTCLITVSWAFELPLTWHQTATVYLAVQVVRQLPLTPGGIGLIEAGLLAGFVAAGALESAAAAVVLCYRIVSFWLMIPAGLAAYLHLTRGGTRGRRPTGATDSEPGPCSAGQDGSFATAQVAVAKRPLAPSGQPRAEDHQDRADDGCADRQVAADQQELVSGVGG
ncbi:hypothetical protein FB565_003068 [Actinoplanes lutulentus]|uniref:Lysylphosphatidylglycerol synthase-like protein n=1 Tax=Actinoplanes lutulentus TaxID=1287878 RepID=A0A327Z333_9ACTN|nr:hypothetical protein [Actinoplanes lutulentus]RAK28413.1 hypothetical protein B0I29_120181 [Actinoplanes lutulentus]